GDSGSDANLEPSDGVRSSVRECPASGFGSPVISFTLVCAPRLRSRASGRNSNRGEFVGGSPVGSSPAKPGSLGTPRGTIRPFAGLAIHPSAPTVPLRLQPVKAGRRLESARPVELVAGRLTELVVLPAPGVAGATAAGAAPDE